MSTNVKRSLGIYTRKRFRVGTSVAWIHPESKGKRTTDQVTWLQSHPLAFALGILLEWVLFGILNSPSLLPPSPRSVSQVLNVCPLAVAVEFVTLGERPQTQSNYSPKIYWLVGIRKKAYGEGLLNGGEITWRPSISMQASKTVLFCQVKWLRQLKTIRASV